MKNINKYSILEMFLTYFMIYLGIAMAVLFIFGKTDIVVKTTDKTYDVNCNFMIYDNGDNKLVEEKVETNNMELVVAYSTLLAVDSDIDNMFGNNIYVIDNYIYYYKNNSDKLFRYNTEDNTIEEFEKSKFINNEELSTSIGIKTIDSEAILNYYPEIIKHIDKLGGSYKYQIFMDKDRIFFVVDNDVYEYHILRDRTRLVMKDVEENIEYIFVK